MRIVVLGAFQDELTTIICNFPPLTELLISKCRCLSGNWNGHEIFISLTGIGTSASAITTTILCENLKPDLIIFCGVAGGLLSSQQIGDLVIANTIFDADLLLLPTFLKDTPYESALTDPHTQKELNVSYSVDSFIFNLIYTFSFERLKLGNLVTSNTFPAPKSLFNEIKNLNCSAIEMESTGIYKAANYYDVPVITIRAISNLLDEAGNDLGTASDALEICSKRLAACLMKILLHVDHVNKNKINRRQEYYYNHSQEPTIQE